MNVLHLILMIVALMCLLLSAFQIQSPRVNLLALGLAFWVLAQMIVSG